jgi:tRNA-dihydrouridine synthase
VVEEALLTVVEEEVLKENGHLTLILGLRIEQEAYRRIYEAEMTDLLTLFRGQMGYANGDSMSLTEKKEFTYWLFKYRVEHSEKAKVASDTRKALAWLQHQWNSSTKHRRVQTAEIQLLLGRTA